MEHRADISCPYVGLTPYTEKEVAYFFGRERETRLIAGKLYAARLTLLYGGSGVGKSSVLRAGVAHTLREEDGAAVVVFSEWQGDPVPRLRAAVAEEVARVMRTRGETVETPSSEAASLGDYLRAAAEHTGQMMLILDQFEEYFLYHPRDDEPGSFAVEFAKMVNRDDVPVSFLISIRQDAYTKLDRFKGRIPNLFASYVHLDHLDAAAARRAITEPLNEYNRQFHPEPEYEAEPALVEAVVRQVAVGRVSVGTAGVGQIGGPAEPTDALGVGPVEARIETPYLQMVMKRLWEKETDVGSSVLRLATLEGLGRAKRIAQAHLDNALEMLSTSEQEIIARDFPYLVTPSGSKIAQSISDLAKWAGVDQTKLKPVLDSLADQKWRILRPVAPPLEQPNALRYEIFHDVLAPAILSWCQQREQAEAARQAALDAQREAQEDARLRAARTARRLRWLAAGLMMVALLIVGFLLRTSMLKNRHLNTAQVENLVLQQKLEDAQTKLDEHLVNIRLPGFLVIVFKVPEEKENVPFFPLVDDPDLELDLACAFARRGADNARKSVTDEIDRFESVAKCLKCSLQDQALNDLESALRILDESEKGKPNDWCTVLGLEDTTRLGMAVVVFEQAKEYARQNRNAEAVEAVNRAFDLQPSLQPVERDPELAAAFKEQARVASSKLENYSKILKLLDQAAKFDPSISEDLPVILVSAGQEYARQAETEAALALLSEAVRLDPESLELTPQEEVTNQLLGRGQELGGQGQTSVQEAEVALAKGRIYALQGKTQQAVAVLRLAVEKDPNLNLVPEIEVALAQARVYAGMNRLDEAVAAIHAAKEISPTLPLNPELAKALRTLAYTAFAPDKKDYEKVLEPLRLAAELDPASKAEIAQLCVDLGRQYVQAGQTGASEAAMREAVDLDENLKLVPEVEVAREQGREYARAGRIDEAVAAMQRALEISPTLQLAEPELARALKVRASTAFSQKADYNKVLLSLSQAVEFDPTSQAEIAQLCVDFGRQYAQQGQTEAALDALRLAVELDPNLKLVPEDEVTRIQGEQK